MKNMEMGANFIGNVRHYFENIKKLIGEAESQKRELSGEEMEQVNADIMSLHHNLELGKITLENAGISRDEYRKFVKPEVAEAA
jgi:hypothetical protein